MAVHAWAPTLFSPFVEIQLISSPSKQSSNSIASFAHSVLYIPRHTSNQALSHSKFCSPVPENLLITPSSAPPKLKHKSHSAKSSFHNHRINVRIQHYHHQFPWLPKFTTAVSCSDFHAMDDPRRIDQGWPKSFGHYTSLVVDNTTATTSNMPYNSGTYSAPSTSNGAYGQGQPILNTPVGGSPHPARPSDHHAWNMRPSSFPGTVQSPPIQGYGWAPQRFSAFAQNMPVPKYTGEHPLPANGTIQSPYSGAVDYLPSHRTAYTTHSASVPYVQDQVAHPSRGYPIPSASPQAVQPSRNPTAHLPLYQPTYDVALSPPHQLHQAPPLGHARAPYGSQMVSHSSSQVSHTDTSIKVQVPSQVGFPYQQNVGLNTATLVPPSRPHTAPDLQHRPVTHGHVQIHSSPTIGDLKGCRCGKVCKNHQRRLRSRSKEAERYIQAFIISEARQLGTESAVRIQEFDVLAYIFSASKFFTGSSSQDPLSVTDSPEADLQDSRTKEHCPPLTKAERDAIASLIYA